MTVPVAEADLYLLPIPAPDSPVVLPKWISPGNVHPVSSYQDLVWSLAPLIDNPSTSLCKVDWMKCPEELRSQVRLTAWMMINGELRPTYLKTRPATARARGSVEDMQDTCRQWIRLARWLRARGITDLAACTDDEWRAYAAERCTSGIGRVRAERILGQLTDLWAFDQLSVHPSGFTRPPWESEGIDDFLPGADAETAGENTTEPLDPQVIGPLLVWAIRVVEDLSPDILAAWGENRRLTALAATTSASPAGRAALEAYLLPLIRSGSPLPAHDTHRPTAALARAFIAASTGASVNQVDQYAKMHGLTALAAERPGPCPLQLPVTGRIHGQPWRRHLEFAEAAVLMRHLGTAAMIICLYLTGMRPQEVQGLRSGCCPDPEPNADGTPGRHLIRSHHYKNVTNTDGHHVSAGEERKVPWVAITPVVHAVRVLERMVPPGELLLSAAHHDFALQRGHHGALKRHALNRRIDAFIVWANSEALA